jgi:DNA-binding transcriptional MerR regulator
MTSHAAETSDDTRMQIGDVAERTGLSLRTIRHYEEIGLLPAASRSTGGFRLYSDEAVERLLVIKQMKPLGFSLEQMRELLEIRDRLANPRQSAKTRSGLLTQQEQYLHLVEQKIIELRNQVAAAQAFAAELRG